MKTEENTHPPYELVYAKIIITDLHPAKKLISLTNFEKEKK